MSIEKHFLSEARRDTDHAAMDLAQHLERPLRRASLANSARRVNSRVADERACYDAEIRRQQKLINSLQAKLRTSVEDAAVQAHRIADLEQQATNATNVASWLDRQIANAEQQITATEDAA